MNKWIDLKFPPVWKLTSTQPNAAAWIWNSTFLLVFYWLTHKSWLAKFACNYRNLKPRNQFMRCSWFDVYSLHWHFFSLFVGQCCCRFEFTWFMKVWLREYSTKWSESVIERLYCGRKKNFNIFTCKIRANPNENIDFFRPSTS